MSAPIRLGRDGIDIARIYSNAGSIVIVCATCSAPRLPGEDWPTGGMWCATHDHVDQTVADYAELQAHVPGEVITEALAAGNWTGLVDTDDGPMFLEATVTPPRRRLWPNGWRRDGA